MINSMRIRELEKLVKRDPECVKKTDSNGEIIYIINKVDPRGNKDISNISKMI